VQLRYHWAKGDEIRYRVTQETETTMTGLPGVGEMTTGQKTVQAQRLTVNDVAADGTATLSMTFESNRMEVSSPMGTMVYDSTAPDPKAASDPAMGAMAKLAGAMIGETITVVMTPTGAVHKIEGMSRIAEKIVKEFPQDPSAGGMMQALKTTLSDEAMRSTLEQNFVQFPANAVTPGQTWTRQFAMTNPVVGTLRASVTSTFKGLETTDGRELARVATSVTIKPETPGGMPGVMGMTVQIGDGTAEGDVQFDVKRGRMHHTMLKSILPMSMSMTAPDGSPVNIDGVVKNTTTVSLVER
jgi:hypothetical protein